MFRSRHCLPPSWSPEAEKALADVFLMNRRGKHVRGVGVGVRGREKEGQREVYCAGLAGTPCVAS